MLKWAKNRQQGWEKKVLFDGDVEVVGYEFQFLSFKEWGILYLPVYNARPCIIRTLVFDLFFLKKKKDFKTKHQELKLPFFHSIDKSWEFINNMLTTISNSLLLQILHIQVPI